MIKNLIIIIIIIINISCSEHDFDNSVNENVDISSGILWEYNLGMNPSDGRIYIKSAPASAVINKLIFDSTGIIYQYQSLGNIKGTDHVIITRDESIGNSRFIETNYGFTFNIE